MHPCSCHPESCCLTSAPKPPTPRSHACTHAHTSGCPLLLLLPMHAEVLRSNLTRALAGAAAPAPAPLAPAAPAATGAAGAAAAPAAQLPLLPPCCWSCSMPAAAASSAAAAAAASAAAAAASGPKACMGAPPWGGSAPQCTRAAHGTMTSVDPLTTVPPTSSCRVPRACTGAQTTIVKGHLHATAEGASSSQARWHHTNRVRLSTQLHAAWCVPACARHMHAARRVSRGS
jgi:hypothetical protein